MPGVDIGAGSAKLHVLTSYGARQDIELHTDDNTMVDKFVVTTQTPPVHTWADVDAALARSGARYSYRVSKVVDGRCEQLAGSNTGESLPLASIFKLYVLYAVAEAVKAGTVSWNDQLTITDEGKTVGSSAFDSMPAGSRISVRTAAGKMIANSDNMATDLLIDRVGTQAVEQALADAGHHDPASMTPFPTMHELFSIGWGEPDLREQWKNADQQSRARLLEEVSARHYEPDPMRTHSPASAYGAEWYGSAEDICRVHAALQTNATGAAAPVKEIMSAIPGIDLDQTDGPISAQGRQLARRADLQLVRGRSRRPTVGGQPADELAAVPRHRHGWLADDDHQADVRADTGALTRPSIRPVGHQPERSVHAFPDSAARSGSWGRCRCARTTSAAHRERRRWQPAPRPGGSPR